MVQTRTLQCFAIASAILAGNSSQSFAAVSGGSSGSALAVHIPVTSNEIISLPNLALAEGSAPPSYSVKTPKMSYSRTVSTADNSSTLTALAQNVTDLAESKIVTQSSMMVSAASYVGSFSATLTYRVPNQEFTIANISAKQVWSKAYFRSGAGGARAATGKASMTKLVIDAPFIGVANLQFSGAPTVNQILFQNSIVTIYVNAQTVTMNGDKKTSIKVDAIDMHFNQSPGGDIEIGSSYAD